MELWKKNINENTLNLYQHWGKNIICQRLKINLSLNLKACMTVNGVKIGESKKPERERERDPKI